MIPYIGAGFSSNILDNPIGNQVPNSLYKRTVANTGGYYPQHVVNKKHKANHLERSKYLFD
jgi:hypothetical protein